MDFKQKYGIGPDSGINRFLIDGIQGDTGGGGGSAITPPMWLSEVDSTHVTVSYATVNGIVPSGGWAGGGDDVGVSVDISGYSSNTWKVYLAATVGATTGVLTAVQVDTTTGSISSDTSTASYRLIGTVAVSTSGTVTAVAPALAWSQEFVACTAGDPASYHWGVA